MDLGLVEWWLRQDDDSVLQRLWRLADRTRQERVGDEVHLRGLVEFGNHCVRACAYCGISATNRAIARYRMSKSDILACAATAHAFGYGTVVLQSGEDPEMSAEWFGDVIQSIKFAHPLAVTLSVGERPLRDYECWRKNGADRYLLKFETSDPELYRRIHPPRIPSGPGRIEILKRLRAMGYQTGSGIMIGIPGQTYSSLARDLELFAELDLDMIGVGPYVPHPDTSLGREFYARKSDAENKPECPPPPDQVPNTSLMARKVVALARIVRPDANIPATTAFATVDPLGFEPALTAGANVIMPNLTPLPRRRLYGIYPIPEYLSPNEINQRVRHSIISIGRRIGAGPGHRIR